MATVPKPFTKANIFAAIADASMPALVACPNYVHFVNAATMLDRDDIKLWIRQFRRAGLCTVADRDAVIAICDATEEVPDPAPTQWSATLDKTVNSDGQLRAAVTYRNAATKEEIVKVYAGYDMGGDKLSGLIRSFIDVLDARDALP